MGNCADDRADRKEDDGRNEEFSATEYIRQCCYEWLEDGVSEEVGRTSPLGKSVSCCHQERVGESEESMYR